MRTNLVCSRGVPAHEGTKSPQTTSEVVGTSPSAPKPPRRSNSMANARATQHDNAAHQRLNQERRATAQRWLRLRSGTGDVSQKVVVLLRPSAFCLASKNDQARDRIGLRGKEANHQRPLPSDGHPTGLQARSRGLSPDVGRYVRSCFSADARGTAVQQKPSTSEHP